MTDSDNVTYTERKFEFGGHKFVGHQWQHNTNAPQAVVFIAHGLHEHGFRYNDFARYLIKACNFAIFAFDHRGHGKSEGVRGLITDMNQVVKDYLAYIDSVLAEPAYASLPVFLFGHSMGGLITLSTAVERPTKWAGVAFSAPLIKLADKIGACTRCVARRLAAINPEMGVEPINVNDLCRDPEFLPAYRADTLINFTKVKAGTGVSLMAGVEYNMQRFERVTFPFLIQHGTADGLCDIKGSQMLYQGAPSKDKTLKTLDGFYHIILREPGKEVRLLFSRGG